MQKGAISFGVCNKGTCLLLQGPNFFRPKLVSWPHSFVLTSFFLHPALDTWWKGASAFTPVFSIPTVWHHNSIKEVMDRFFYKYTEEKMTTFYTFSLCNCRPTRSEFMPTNYTDRTDGSIKANDEQNLHALYWMRRTLSTTHATMMPKNYTTKTTTTASFYRTMDETSSNTVTLLKVSVDSKYTAKTFEQLS